MIHVIATIRVQPGTRDEFLRHFRELTPKVRAEVGCLEYGATVDVATNIAAQVPAGDDAVVVVEKWESLAALEAHLIAPHMLAYREAVKSLVAGVTLQVLEPV